MEPELRIFISYSHAREDKRWLRKLQTHLAPVLAGGQLSTWADSDLGVGEQWREEIQKALDWANVAILMVSDNFLSSTFIAQNELPPLLEASRQRGLTLVWVAVSSSAYRTSPIAAYQCAHDPATPLDMLTAAKATKVLVDIVQKIQNLSQRPQPASAPKAPGFSNSGDIDIHRVVDPTDPVLAEALAACAGLIPDDEMYEEPDLVRWLRRDADERRAGIERCREFLFVAREPGAILGFLYFHYYFEQRLAFVSYLARCKTIDTAIDSLGRTLLMYMQRLLEQSEELKSCRGIVTEVDDPGAVSGDERMRRLGRAKLFFSLSEAFGVPLRVFDIPYLQPKLSLADPTSQEKSMLLLYAFREVGGSYSEVEGRVVGDILKFVYGTVYPDGYSDDLKETTDYQAYLATLLEREVSALPAAIRALEWKGLKAKFVARPAS